MPVENLIRQHQGGYYQALQASCEPEIDAAPFIDYMLNVIEESLADYEQRAQHRQGTVETGCGVGINVGINGSEAVLQLLREEPKLTASALAIRLGKSTRSIERYLHTLVTSGAIRREGSHKSGHWVVAD